MNQTLLKTILDYDELTGVFTWKENSRRGNIGKIAGNSTSEYVRIGYLGKSYMAHRLAWMYVHGYFPKGIIDHKNRNKHDNKILNLRDATSVENNRNIPIQKNNTSSTPGVVFHKRDKYWQSSIYENGKQIHLGSFKDKDEAVEARKNAEIKYGYDKSNLIGH